MSDKPREWVARKVPDFNCYEFAGRTVMGRMIFMSRLLASVEMTYTAWPDRYAMDEGVILMQGD